MKNKICMLIVLLLSSGQLLASTCPNTPLNPLTDISWECLFPVRIGGVVQLGSNNAEADDTTMDPICVCNGGAVPKVGISVSFWEPARIIDTVSDPYCMMPIGTKMANPTPGRLSGSMSRRNGATSTFQQMHYYMFPALTLLDMFTDISCVDQNPFDVAMMTEVLPTWNNDILSLIVNPESVLFANPVAQLACAADASTSMFDKPINELFWCMGSWGSTYPLAGSITGSDYVESNAALAARSIYLMGRLGLLTDSGLDGCSMHYTPIWRKDRYKLQLMKPVRDTCHKIGKTGLLWTGGKHPPANADNFMWMMFRKVNCCVTYEY